MTTKLRSFGGLVGVAMVLSQYSAADPDDPEEPKRVSEAIEKSVARYDLFVVDKDTTTPLTPKVVIRWKNVRRNDSGDSLMVFWPHNGRPVAMATLYGRGASVAHEFDSLMREGKLIARDKDAEVWAPAKPGLKFQPVPDAPKPAAKPLERLLQMKEMVKRFSATFTGWSAKDKPEELRLLPRQLFRYDVEKLPETLDGAVFAFVEGTDPEVILIFEATKDGDKAAWHYAIVRASSGGLEVKLDGKIVWEAEQLPINNDKTLPHLTTWARIQP